MRKKAFYTSKTFWVNLIALVAVIVQHYTSWVIDASIQAVILGAVNILLRGVTHDAIDWTSTKTLLIAFAVPVFFTISCASLHDAAIRRPINLITCEYDKYVKADSKLQPESKRIRLHTAALLRKEVKADPCGGGK